MMRLLKRFPLIVVVATLGLAQAFSSGSTGSDGALDLSSGDRVIQLPPSGILNYATVNIPAGRTLSFARNVQNTPVVMLSQGTVTVAGTINVNAPTSSQNPGPGGFFGGTHGLNGFGAGGGVAAGPNTNGSWVGPLSLVPIIGGSGGAGVSPSGCPDAAGGGGGGAIVIASSAPVVVSGAIVAKAPTGL